MIERYEIDAPDKTLDHLGRVEHADDERGARRPPDGPAGERCGRWSTAFWSARVPARSAGAASRCRPPRRPSRRGWRSPTTSSSCTTPRTSTTPTRWRTGARCRPARPRSAIGSRRCAELRIVAEGTDLTMDVGGRKWINADGHENFPDGEVFTSPVEANTQGHIALLVRRALRRAARWAAYGCGSRTGCVVREEAEPGRRLPARDARSGRGIAEAGRGRLRAERRDPDRHRQHRLRREDRRHLPRRPGRWRSRWPAAPTSPPCTGTWSATCATAARCTATASCCRRDGKFL